jgi:hypothetical protein
MFKVKDFYIEVDGCPFCAILNTDCGERLYLRYRFGRLKVGVLEKDHEYPKEWFFDEAVGDKLDGLADTALFRKALSGIAEIPKEISFES